MGAKIIIFIFAILLFLSVYVDAKRPRDIKKAAKERELMKCGVCHVVMKNLQNIKLNSQDITNKGPYSMVTDVLIDESMSHACGVSHDSITSMGFDSMEVQEVCYDFMWTHGEEIEEILLRKNPFAVDTICSEELAVCKDIPAESIPRPTVNVPLPVHPKDKQPPAEPSVEEHEEL